MSSEAIVAEIRKHGPISFERYMEMCLYDPEWGYYTARRRERFGRDGDYYTSAQLGTLFARLMAQRFSKMREELGGGDFTVIEVGAGRGDFGAELRRVAPDLRYVAVEYGDAWPAEPIRGCIFSNEFFDALPVRTYRGDTEVRVTEHDGVLGWDGEPPTREFSPHAGEWMRRFAETLEAGYVVAVDYGYRGRGRDRFQHGSLMTYQRHQASEDVFADPGDRDITAHVDFDQLVEAGVAAGLRETAYDPQSRYLMRIGEQDQFACVLEGWATETQRVQATLLLKNLLFGIGETMSVLEMLH